MVISQGLGTEEDATRLNIDLVEVEELISTMEPLRCYDVLVFGPLVYISMKCAFLDIIYNDRVRVTQS
jgi:hypothetical protein